MARCYCVLFVFASVLNVSLNRGSAVAAIIVSNAVRIAESLSMVARSFRAAMTIPLTYKRKNNKKIQDTTSSGRKHRCDILQTVSLPNNRAINSIPRNMRLTPPSLTNNTSEVSARSSPSDIAKTWALMFMNEGVHFRMSITY